MCLTNEIRTRFLGIVDKRMHPDAHLMSGLYLDSAAEEDEDEPKHHVRNKRGLMAMKHSRVL